MSEKTIPFHKQIHSVTIDALSHEGRGISTLNERKCFVRGALPDETVECRILKKHASRYEAIADTIKSPSTRRIEARCRHYGQCGGCNLQHMSAEHQITFKQSVLIEQLQHFGNVQPLSILPPLTGPIWGYRHKARLGVKYDNKKQKVIIGFREINARYINDTQRCLVLHPTIGERIPQLQTLIHDLSIRNKIPQIEVAVGDNEAALIIRHLVPFTSEDIKRLSDFSTESKLHIYLQSKGIDSITQLTPQAGSNRLHYAISNPDIRYQFHPSDFTQINLAINRAMIAQAIQLLAPDESTDCLDLFCGLGNFTLPLAKHCHSVTGVEGSQQMVDRAYENAQLNNIDNTKFYAADLNKEFNHAPWAKQQYHSIILDPPRSGAENIITHIDQFNAEKIIYVSCNPATLARDAGELVHKHGYQLMNAGIMDMFPHTSHVEAMAFFTRTTHGKAR